MIDFQFVLQRSGFRLEAALQPASHVTGIFGPSGSGKSTLLGLLAGTLKPDSGYFSLHGEYVIHTQKGIQLPPHRRRIGMMFQESRLFPHLSVEGNLRYGYQLLKPSERRFAFADIVRLLELEEFLQRQPHQLSGGQRQRVALGRTLLASPKLLLFDEPLAALDARLKAQILPFLQRVRDEIDIPMLYVSHAIDEILHLTSSLAVMEQGNILAYGEFYQVMRNSKVLALASSLGMENVFNAEVLSHDEAMGYSVLQWGGETLHVPLVGLPAGRKVSVSALASNIALATHKFTGLSIQNQIAGTIAAIRQVDHRVLVDVQIGSDVVVAEVSGKAVSDLGLALGRPIYCLIKAQSLRTYA